MSILGSLPNRVAMCRWLYRRSEFNAATGNMALARHFFRYSIALDPTRSKLEKALARNWYPMFNRRRQAAAWVEVNLESIKLRAESLDRAEAAERRVYAYWGQGREHAPPIVDMCMKQMRRWHKEKFVFLDDTSLPNYLDLTLLPPQSIMSKAHYSDIVRLALLVKFGGVWCDATCLCTRDIVKLYRADTFFMYSYNDTRSRISNWLIVSPPSNYICRMMLSALLEYWSKPRKKLAYRFFHHFFEALYLLDRRFAAEWHKARTADREVPHFLQRNMTRNLHRSTVRQLLRMSPVHKLTHKYKSAEGSKVSVVEQLLRMYSDPERGNSTEFTSR
jgi:hypothetical protein